MKRFRRKIPLIVALVVVAGLLVYGFWPAAVQVDAIAVQRGSFEITVNDDGETRIREKYIVTSPVAGKLLRVELHAGDSVRRGTSVLFHIEPRDATPLDARSQAEAEARVRAAEAACQVAQARRKESEEALELAKHEYDRSLPLVKRRAISQSDYDRAEHAWRMAQTDLRSAEFAVQVADFECELAQAALVRTRADMNGSDVKPVITISSPIDGSVLRVFTEDAGVVEPGTQIMELGDPTDLELEIDVLSTAAVRIEPGAKVYVDHWGGHGTLEGVVRTVEPAAFLKVSALGVEEKRVNIIAEFRGALEDRQALGDGFRIEARIVVATADNIVKVPAGAVFRHARSWHTYRIVDGKAQLQPVTVGKSNGLETEITEGLSPGDVVVLHPTDRVTNGASVSPIFL
jgi:HlyD family secretion protein